jgi:small subunit ribosomal protein S20
MRTLIKKVLNSSDKAQAEVLLKDAVSYIDRMSQKGIVHPNNAARKKARLTKHVNNL